MKIMFGLDASAATMGHENETMPTETKRTKIWTFNDILF
jgi:hypothetical protein